MILNDSGFIGRIKHHVLSKIVRFAYGNFTDVSHIMQNNYDLRGIDAIITTDGISYKATPESILTVPQAISEYNYSDIRKSDIVLDIGACCGGFALKAAKQCRHVFAVEPIFHDQLIANIQSNKIDNITVIKGMLGETGGTRSLIAFKGVESKADVYTFSDLVELSGGSVDVLKCDIEGDERFINATNLHGIRRIEMELHEAQSEWAVKLLAWLKEEYKTIDVNFDGTDMALIHAFDRGEI